MRNFFGFAQLSVIQFGISTLTGFVVVIWFELYKLIKRKKNFGKTGKDRQVL
jgi:hypothetical protein